MCDSFALRLNVFELRARYNRLMKYCAFCKKFFFIVEVTLLFLLLSAWRHGCVVLGTFQAFLEPQDVVLNAHAHAWIDLCVQVNMPDV